ncbi:hypothetical protein BDV38DRAFT_276479 [Aspergillus pseudotamarii]|uniref:Uncharacterized protein n=1 Tax=Aspergillus pseudotamarii TaxID=132259 RepID=A0A5N6S827_ASPPS|nr:uncharacterized protein BDV38DRAFT_276479 [Aspergillus pseudotamarii]KAE8130818.1 hypothetical protein BDV38DRAFT_276479 [Aspergillus pseudotamarii]
MRWFSAAFQNLRAAVQKYLSFMGSLPCPAFETIDSEEDLTSLRPLSSSSTVQLPTPPLSQVVVAGKPLKNAIVGTYEPRTKIIVLDGSHLPIPFKAEVPLQSCKLKRFESEPTLSSNGHIDVSFTYVNIKAWTAVVSVPYRDVKVQLARSAFPAYQQDYDYPAPPNPVRLMQLRQHNFVKC